MTEAQYQSKLINKLKRRFPGCQVVKNDPSYQQGFPDLTVLFNDRWAVLEVKASSNSALQPNQNHFIDRLTKIGFASFIYPENEEDVLNAMEQALAS